VQFARLKSVSNPPCFRRKIGLRRPASLVTFTAEDWDLQRLRDEFLGGVFLTKSWFYSFTSREMAVYIFFQHTSRFYMILPANMEICGFFFFANIIGGPMKSPLRTNNFQSLRGSQFLRQTKTGWLFDWGVFDNCNQPNSPTLPWLTVFWIMCLIGLFIGNLLETDCDTIFPRVAWST